MDFKNTIIELMSKTDAATVDLTGFIPQIEATITEGLKKATGGRISAYVCDTKDIFKVADEEPLTGRRFGGSMFLDGYEYSYYICFNANGLYGGIVDKKLNKGVHWNPLGDNSTNWCLNTLAEFRDETTSEESKKWYTKLSRDDIQDIVDRAEELKAALRKANAKILFTENGSRIVPADTEVHYGDPDTGFVELDENEFSTIELPHNIISLDDERLVAPVN